MNFMAITGHSRAFAMMIHPAGKIITEPRLRGCIELNAALIHGW